MASSPRSDERYRESRIQDAFISWFSRITRYTQVYEDAHTQQNTPMDSVGFIGARPVLIEVKASVHAGMVLHADRAEGNLEYKVYRVIRDLYARTATPIGQALSAWDRSTPPEIIFVAGTYSFDALTKLEHMLANWGPTGHFGARIYQWDGTQGICLYVLSMSNSVVPEQVVFPELRPLTAPQRAPKLTLGAVRALLAEKGLDGCLDAMLAEMEQRGIEIRVRNVRNINFGKTTLESSKKVTLVGIWPYASTANDGLVVSADLAAFPQCFPVAPVSATHIRAPVAPPVGFLNYQCYLRSAQDVAAFWDTVAPKGLLLGC